MPKVRSRQFRHNFFSCIRFTELQWILLYFIHLLFCDKKNQRFLSSTFESISNTCHGIASCFRIEVKVLEVVRVIKWKAIQHSNAPPSSIFREEIATIRDNEIVSNLLQIDDMSRTINCVQNQHQPIHRVSLEDLTIIVPHTHKIMEFDIWWYLIMKELKMI